MNPQESCGDRYPTIAVIGFSVRAAAQSARRQGYVVVAVDMCGDRDLLTECKMYIRLDDPDWPSILNAQFPTAPLLLTGGMEHRCRSVDRCHFVANRLGPTGNQIDAMRSLENWEEWAREAEIAWPMTIRTSSNVWEVIQQNPESHWLLKSLQSAGGTGTIDITETLSHRHAVPLEQSNGYIQKRLPGKSIGVTFLSSEFGCAVVGFALAWPSDSQSHHNAFIYSGSVGPIALRVDEIDKLNRFARVVWNRTDLLGLWQADFLLAEGGLTLLEINPRWSASMDLLDVACDLGLAKMHVDAICKSLSKSSFEQFSRRCSELFRVRDQADQKSLLGKLIVYADRPFNVTSAQSDYWWAHRWKGDGPTAQEQCYFADIPVASTAIPLGAPILTVMTTGKTEESILRTLQSSKSIVVVS